MKELIKGIIIAWLLYSAVGLIASLLMLLFFWMVNGLRINIVIAGLIVAVILALIIVVAVRLFIKQKKLRKDSMDRKVDESKQLYKEKFGNIIALVDDYTNLSNPTDEETKTAFIEYNDAIRLLGINHINDDAVYHIYSGIGVFLRRKTDDEFAKTIQNKLLDFY